MKKFVTFLAFALIGVLSLGLITVSNRVESSIKTRDLTVIEYEIGGLGESGKATDTTESIVTRDFINVSGLTVTVGEDSNVEYQLFFYTDEKDFISSTDVLSTDFASTSVVSNAKYFKIVITPTKDAEVGILEVSKYAKSLTVTVNK